MLLFKKEIALISYRFEYFDEIVQPFIKELRKDYVVIVCPRESKRSLFAGRAIFALSKYINHHVFLSVETSGVNFPIRLIKSMRVQAFHGLGMYNLRNVERNLNKYHYYFTPNSYFEDILPKDKIRKLGYPSLDKLLNKESFERSSAQSRVIYYAHWNNELGFEKSLTKVYEMFNDAEVKTVKFHKYIKEELSDTELSALVDKCNKLGFELEFGTGRFSEKGSCTYVIDLHSSAALEAALLGKDVFAIDVLSTNDKLLNEIRDEYRVNQGDIFKLNHFMGKYCYNLGQSQAVIRKLMRECVVDFNSKSCR